MRRPTPHYFQADGATPDPNGCRGRPSSAGARMATSTRFKTRSPIETKPLRLPGDTLREGITDKLLYVFACLAIVVFTLSMILTEWMRWLKPAPPQPLGTTIIAGLAGLVVLWRARVAWREYLQMRRGLEGEVAVGELLDEMRIDGFHVLHDVPGPNWNIDHVLVGPQGVFAIETKTVGKGPGKHRVVYDGKEIVVAGRKPERDPLEQAAAAERWLRDFMKSRLSLRVGVQGVVLYPGWWIQNEPGTKSIWVLNPKGLAPLVKSRPEVLCRSEIERICASLRDYVRVYD